MDIMIGRRGAGAREQQTPALVPLARETLHDKVYAHLSEALRRGEFEMGQVLTLRTLAARLGVSPMPVREVVARLVNEGVLEVMPNRHVRVPLLSVEQYEALTEARVANEGHAAWLAAGRIDTPGLDALAEANQRLLAAARRHDHATIMQANRDVHFTVYRAARSPRLLQIIENLWKQSGPYLATIESAMASRPRMRNHDFGAGQHDVIHSALARHDADAARAALVDDIQGFAQIYRALLVSPGTPTAADDGDTPRTRGTRKPADRKEAAG